MRNAVKILLAVAAVTVLGSAPSYACGRGWNVDAYGRCFPAWMGTGVETGGGGYYAPRSYYEPRAYYAPQYNGYYPRHYRRGSGHIYFRF